MAGSTWTQGLAGRRCRSLAAAGLVIATLPLAGDARAATFELVSVDSDGTPGTDSSFQPAISADGRCVAFDSFAVLAPGGEGYPEESVYLRDRTSRTTELVSVPAPDAVGAARGANPAISADCRLVAFESTERLALQDLDSASDVYVRDRATGTTELMSNSSATGLALNAAISADGRRVAFEFGNGVWVRDRRREDPRRVSVPAAGVEASSRGEDPSISGDGLRVVFESLSALTGDDLDDGEMDVFLRDLATGTTLRVSAPGPDGEDDGESFDAFISADGNHVVFKSTSRLVAADDDLAADLYLHDLASGTLELLGGPAPFPVNLSRTTDPALSGEGRLVAFTSGGDDEAPELYLIDRLAGTVRLVVRPGEVFPFPALSADGRHLAFASRGVPASPGVLHVIVADLELEPAVAADAEGTLLFVWQGVDEAGLPAVFGRFHDGDAPLGEAFQVSESPTVPPGDAPSIGGPAADPAVAALGAGRFLVVWAADGDDAILSRSVDRVVGGAPGLGLLQNVSGAFATATNGVGAPVVAAAPDGRYVVVWESFALPRGSGRQGLAAALFTAAGQFVPVTVPVSVDRELAPEVAMAADGSFAAVATFIAATSPIEGGTGIISRRFDALGVPQMAAGIRVNRFVSGQQAAPVVTALPGVPGKHMVAWQGQHPGPGYGIFARRLPEAFGSSEPEFQVNSQIGGDQRTPAIAADVDGFLVAWRDTVSGTVKLQRFLASETSVTYWDSEVDLGVETLGFGPPRVVSLPDGRFAVVYGLENELSVAVLGPGSVVE